ncbi:unnamed protein product, partial [Rotaria sp. Silwood1]
PQQVVQLQKQQQQHPPLLVLPVPVLHRKQVQLHQPVPAQQVVQLQKQQQQHPVQHQRQQQRHHLALVHLRAQHLRQQQRHPAVLLVEL